AAELEAARRIGIEGDVVGEPHLHGSLRAQARLDLVEIFLDARLPALGQHERAIESRVRRQSRPVVARASSDLQTIAEQLSGHFSEDRFLSRAQWSRAASGDDAVIADEIAE